MFYKRLAHVCLHVKDLKRSLEFYRKLGAKDRFDFAHKGRDYGRYLEIADNTFLEIFEEPKPEPLRNDGLAHFCLETEKLDALIAHLDTQGVPHTAKHMGADFTWQIWLTDPDGNRFEIHEYTDKSFQSKGGTVEVDWLD